MKKKFLIKKDDIVCELSNGKMKYYPFFCCFRNPFFIYSFFIVFVLLFLSKPAVAMPYLHDTYVHAAADSDVKVGQPRTENNREIHKGLLHLASQNFLCYRNAATEESLPLKGDGVNSVITDAAAVDCDSPATSGTMKKAAKQRKWFDICENDKQVADKLSLHSVSIRAAFSNNDIIGGLAPEDFQEFDVAVNLRLPWGWYSKSGWGADIRLMTSAGALYGAGETALVVSLIPLVTLGSQDGRFTLDMGAGGAILSRHSFGTQNFGGHFQFALTAGVGVPLFKQLGVGYRYLHYSDAAIYGPRNTGADFHMLELTYRF
jgi:hypothetical protein